MIAGPHITGFSFVAFCNIVSSVSASARRPASGIFLMNAVTFSFVGFVWFSAMVRSQVLFCRFPLEADRVSIGVFQVKLLHSVPGDLWRVELKTLCHEVMVNRVYIGGT